MKKKGFTLVELLGVIVILAIVLGLAVLAYVNNQGSVNTTYYKTLEESLLIPGGDYFNYNKGEQPSVFGDEQKVTAQVLKDEGYIEDDIAGSDGEGCDLQNSYVGAYKNSKDKTNYYACLSCGEYKTDSPSCNGEADYTLGVRANKKESKDTYNPNGKNWSDENIVLTFETLNDMDEVELEDESGSKVGSCKLKEVRGIKSCTIEVSESGNYKAYAKNGENETRKEDIDILIDKTKPDFEFQDKGVDGKIEVLVDNVNAETEVKNRVYDIKDSESGIKSVEYSFVEEGAKDNYQGKGVVESFDIGKNLRTGVYYLRVRVTNNAGMTTEKVLEYHVFKKIVEPTKASHCNDLTYNGVAQTLVKSAGEGYTFEYTTGTEAKDYPIGIILKEGYRYSDGTDTPKNLVCTIKTKDLIVKANNQTITYGDTFNTTNINGVTVTGLASGDSISGITLNYAEKLNVANKRLIYSSNIKIKRGEADVTNNYKAEYQTGELTINPKITFTVEGTKEQSGYQKGASVTVTCESIDEITNFTITDDANKTTILTGGLTQSSKVTLNTNGKNRTIKGVCKSENGSSEQSSQYHIYIYSQNKACSCKTPDSCSAAGCSKYSSWSCGSASMYTASLNPGYTYTYSKLSCTKDSSHSSPNLWMCKKCTRSCSTYKSSESKCGCKTRNSCWHL